MKRAVQVRPAASSHRIWRGRKIENKTSAHARPRKLRELAVGGAQWRRVVQLGIARHLQASRQTQLSAGRKLSCSIGSGIPIHLISFPSCHWKECDFKGLCVMSQPAGLKSRAADSHGQVMHGAARQAHAGAAHTLGYNDPIWNAQVCHAVLGNSSTVCTAVVSRLGGHRVEDFQRVQHFAGKPKVCVDEVSQPWRKGVVEDWLRQEACAVLRTGQATFSSLQAPKSLQQRERPSKRGVALPAVCHML